MIWKSLEEPQVESYGEFSPSNYETKLDAYISYLIDGICDDGVSPLASLIVYGSGKSESLSLWVMFMDAEELVAKILKRLVSNKNITELYLAVDCYTDGKGGAVMDSCLLIVHCVRGSGARLGVVEYSWNKGNPISLPIDWENEYWIDAHADLLTPFGVAMTGVLA